MSSVEDDIASGSEDEMYFAEIEWRKLDSRSRIEGYREGRSKASEDSLQSGRTSIA